MEEWALCFFLVNFQDVDLDRQSLSSIDKNASERGQSQLSNPTDDGWKARPYASKTPFLTVFVFICLLF